MPAKVSLMQKFVTSVQNVRRLSHAEKTFDKWIEDNRVRLEQDPNFKEAESIIRKKLFGRGFLTVVLQKGKVSLKSLDGYPSTNNELEGLDKLVKDMAVATKVGRVFVGHTACFGLGPAKLKVDLGLRRFTY